MIPRYFCSKRKPISFHDANFHAILSDMVLSSSDENLLAERLSFWQHLTAEEKRFIMANTSSVTYPAQYTLRTGDRSCIGIIAIKKGQLRVYMLSPEGRNITLFRLEKHNICVLSAACVLDAIMFDVCIDTEAETEALIINSSAFKKLTETNIYVKEFSYELAAERFSDIMWTMQQILFMSFDRRLAIFLAGEIDKSGKNTIALTHEQIAVYTGSAREVVTRMLKYFSAEGIVSLSRGIITVLNPEKLKKIASLPQPACVTG